MPSEAPREVLRALRRRRGLFTTALATADHSLRAGAARHALVVWGSGPARGDAVRLKGAWRPRFAQEGQTVFRWATTEPVPLIERACERSGTTPGELGGIVTHQANLRVIESLVGWLGVEGAVVARAVVDSGNTSAASVPLALSKLVERREIEPGVPVLLFAFGGGLSWAGQVVTCP